MTPAHNAQSGGKQFYDEAMMAIRRFANDGNRDDFEDWIVSNIQRGLDSRYGPAMRLIDEFDAAFIQMGEGLATLQEIHDRACAIDRLSQTIRIPAESVHAD